MLHKETIDVRRVGTALIGGDFTGNARGSNALDIQTTRSAVTQVASDTETTTVGINNTANTENSIAIGHGNTASGSYGSSIAIGISNTAGGYGNNAAIGYNNTISGYYGASAIGVSNEVTADSASALGYGNTAGGKGSTAAGYSNTTSNYYSSAIGFNNTASAYHASAIGASNTASATRSSAIGYNCETSATDSTAIGSKAIARIQKTINICGPQIIRKDDGEAAGIAFESFCGVEVILMSKEVDMKVVADHTITLPANCHFWLNEIGIIARTVTDLVTQPTVRYGITGDLDKHNAAAITTALTAADKREIEIPLVPEDGEISLTGGITIAADATAFTGRFYWKGMFVEDE